MMKKVLATTGVISAALVLTAGPAVAGTNIKTTAAAGSVSNCVITKLNDSGYTDHLRVTNSCTVGKRVKVVLAHHTDFPCEYFAPGDARDYSWPYPGRFDRLESC
jgi:hypothetical protein